MRRCLVVDDSPLIRRVARLVLERHRIAVDEAETVDAALDICKRTMPDSIILDWILPGKPALELMSGLAALAPQPMPYVVYCMTEHDHLAISRAFEAGCEGILLKPFLACDLEAKLGLTSTPIAA